MKLVDRYILLAALRLMVATIVIGVSVLTLARLIIILRLRSIDDQDFGTILSMLGYFMPNYFGFMLPFALFLACYMVTRRISGNSEVRALSAAGITQKRLVIPLVALGLITVLLNFVVYGWFEPVARYSYRSLAYKIENTASYLAVQPGVFMKAGNRTIYVDDVDRSDRTFKGLLIYEESHDGFIRQIIAERGRLFLGGEIPKLLLENGNRIVNKPVRLASTALEKPEENLVFSALELPLISSDGAFHARGNDEEELTLPELISYRESPPAGSTPARMSVQFQHKLVVIFTALILPFFAVAMGQTSPREANYMRAPIAFVLLVIYYQLVEFGKVFSRENGYSSLVLLWPIFLIMAAVSILAFLSLDLSRNNLIVLRVNRFGQALQNFTTRLTERAIPRLVQR